jgi:hypothetical protein
VCVCVCVCVCGCGCGCACIRRTIIMFSFFLFKLPLINFSEGAELSFRCYVLIWFRDASD